MTLVEVVASLALLGSLLGASVIAQARLTRQWTAAQERAEAVEALDAQLTDWHNAIDILDTEAPAAHDQPIVSGFPLTGEGPLDVAPWWWRVEIPEDQPGLDLGIERVRYVAFDPSDLSRQAASSIDVLVYTAGESQPTELSALGVGRPAAGLAPQDSASGVNNSGGGGGWR